MARMAIDDLFLRDPRIVRLGKLMAWSRRETMGALMDVWAVAYDRVSDALSTSDIDIAADRDGFAEAMISVELASYARSNSATGGLPMIRIRGISERIAYLRTRADTGRVGGLKSAELRAKKSKVTLPPLEGDLQRDLKVERRSPQGRVNPLPLVPDLVLPLPPDLDLPPVPDPKNCDSPSARAKTPPDPNVKVAIGAFDFAYRSAYGASPTWGKKQGGQVKELISKHGISEVSRRIEILFSSPPNWLTPPFDIGTLVQHFDKLVKPASAQSPMQYLLDVANGASP